LGEQARAAGQRKPLDWARSRPPSSELQAVQRALEAAEDAQAAVHFVHISTAAAARLVSAAKDAGHDVSLETCPHYLLLDETDADRLGGLGKCAPPLRAQHEVEQLWQTLLEGKIDCVASDHSPCPPQMKESADIWSVWGGISGVQTSLCALLSEGVHRHGLSLPDVVRLTSDGPAKRLGLYPRKGALTVGSDADVVLVDLDTEWTLQPADLQTRWPMSPFLGRSYKGQVVATLVRGTPVWQNNTTQVNAGFGQLVRR